MCACVSVCVCVCLSVANVARSQQLLSNKLSAVRVKRQEAAVKTMRRCLAESPKSPSRNSQDADKVRGQARAGQARRGLTGDHLTIRALFIPQTHLASSVVDYVEKRAQSGKAQEASLA